MKKTVVLIDDDLVEIEMMTGAIKKIAPDFHCIGFANAEKALLAIRELATIPDYVFIDLNMPVKTGMDCLKELRKDSRFTKVSLIITSSFFHSEVRDTLVKHGADHVLEKAAFAKLLHLLQEIFEIS